MEYISSKGYIIEDPFAVRPGSLVKIKANLSKSVSYNWDSSTTFSKKIYNAFFTINSIKSNISFDLTNINLNYYENATKVTIQPVNSGTITLTIYYNTTEKVTIRSKSALDSAESDIYNEDNYEYIIEHNGTVCPMALIDLNGVFTLSEIKDLEVISLAEDRGICYTGDQNLRINSQGKLSSDIYVLRRGYQMVWTSGKYTGKYKKESSDKKYIKIDNQECIRPNMQFYGIEYIRDTLFVLTSNGLYGFEKRSNFIDWKNKDQLNEFHWPTIRGTDITYTSDDYLAVANDIVINKYKIRHDFILMDKNDDRIYAREQMPDFDLS